MLVTKYRANSCEVYWIDRSFMTVGDLRRFNAGRSSRKHENNCYMCGASWGADGEFLALALVKKGDNGNILVCQKCAAVIASQEDVFELEKINRESLSWAFP